MPTNFSRATQRFAVRGLQLAKTPDELATEELAVYKNLRQFILGQLQTREGLSVRNSSAMTGLIIHSIRRLNNDLTSASQANTLVVGNDTRLDTSNAAGTTFTNRATGFSGNPLSLIPFRPDQSPEPWMYVGDATKMGKVNVAGTFQNWGIAPPAAELSAEFAIRTPDELQGGIIQAFNGAGGITNGGTAGAPAAFARINTTITHILYDSGSTGACSIAPASMAQIGVNCVVEIGGERCPVDAVYKATVSTTIASIVYDTSNTGPCTITLTSTPREGLIRDAMFRIAAAENVRVLSANQSPDGVPSFRCVTTGARVAGNAIVGLASFRIYTANNHAAAEAIIANAVRSTVTTGIGTLSYPSAIDLSVINGRPTGPKDRIHASIRCDNLENLIEGRILFDLGGGAGAYTENYFYVTFRPNDFVAATTSTITQLTAKQRKLQRKLIDSRQRIEELEALIAGQPFDEGPQRGDFESQLSDERARARSLKTRLKQAGASPSGVDGSSDETTTGANQWTEFKFRINVDAPNGLQRVGSDESLGLKDVVGIRVQFNVSASTVCDVNEFYAYGSYGLNVSQTGIPYAYMYRYRSGTTGAKSLWSPPTRNGVYTHRQRVILTPTASGDSQVDKIDYARFGGDIAEWVIIATSANSGTFTDALPDDEILENPRAQFIDYQPFPVQDIPRSSTVTVVGTTVTRTAGDNFNTSWARGTICFINGVPNRLFAQPASTLVLQLEQSAGSQSSVILFIPEPLILGQPLPAVWGPYGEGQIGQFMFACGAVNQPGTLFWTNGNNPDSANEVNTLEITNPSEPLMNGGIYDGRAFVWSTQRLFVLTMEFDQFLQRPVARALEVPNGKGLFARFGFAIGPKVWFVAQDGIYETIGGEPRLITTDLYPLFPHDGQPGFAVNGVTPPDFTVPNGMKLSYADGMVYFDYIDTGAARRTLVYNTLIGGWNLDVYTPTVASHYQEEGRGVHSVLVGGTNGKIYGLLQSATDDAGTVIACALRTGAFDAREFRSQKLWSDLIIDYLSAVSITTTVGFDNYTSTAALTALAIQAARDQVIRDLNSGEGVLANNIALDLVWSGQAQLFGWEPSWLARPEDTALRVTENDNLGYAGAKFVQGIIIEADTANVAKSILIQADTGTNGVMTTQTGTLTAITHNGRAEQAYSFATPFIAHEVRILGNDTDPWKLYNWRWVWEPMPELVTDWITQATTIDNTGFFHIREMQIAHISSADITLSVIWDDGTNAPTTDTYTIAHGSGAYRKTYIVVQARKMKSVTFKLVSAAGCRIFLKDLEVKNKSWGLNAPYTLSRPFGDISRENGGARI